MLTTTSLIETALSEDGTRRIKVGERTVFETSDAGIAALAESAVRRAYALGRRDQRTETSAILRGLMHLG